MAIPTTTLLKITFITIIFGAINVTYSLKVSQNQTLPQSDIDQIEFALNLEYLEAEYFLWGSLGHGLDQVAPELAGGGPPPIGVKKAFLNPFFASIVYQLGLQGVGHIRHIKKTVQGFPRPQINLTIALFQNITDTVFERRLYPNFDPYANSINFLIGIYLFPHLAVTSYLGASPKLQSQNALKLVGSLMAVKAGQEAIIRTLLYQRRLQLVYPYGITVQEFVTKISNARNKLAKNGIRDEGIFVDQSQSVDGKIPLNIFAVDQLCLPFTREPEEILRILYSSGDEKSVGGFFPKGANGRIARSYLGS